MNFTKSPSDDELIAQDMEEQRAFAAAQILKHRMEIEAFKDYIQVLNKNTHIAGRH